jgi:D-alanyl-D-alanine carboxypeptidase (penicillin-binding protein 5/6)
VTNGDIGPPGGDPPAAPPPTGENQAATDSAGGTVIHLGGNRRPPQESDAGEVAPSTYGLTALGRAQARTGRTAGPSSSVGPVFGPSGRRRRRRLGRTGRLGRRRARPDGWPARPGAHRSRRQRRVLRTIFLVFLAAAVVAVAAAVFVGVQLRRSVPQPVLHSAVPAAVAVAAPVPRLPWPASVESAVAVRGLGTIGQSGPTAPVPIASLTKVMTAFVLLRDHPLHAGQSGPQIPISAADQAAYRADEAAGDSTAPVLAGETLSELQLLQGLLIPSADNLAPVVARWDAGSQAAFVAKMNAAAAALDMHATHYADPAGVSASTTSTAADQLRLAQVVAANPVLMSIVRQPQLVFPNDPQLLTNYNSYLGRDGIVGIKTGATSAAGGCFMFAADGTAGGHPVEVLGVVLGVTATPLIASALHTGQSLIGPALAGLHPVTALPAGTVVAHVADAWGRSVAVSTAKPVTIMHVGPTSVRLSLVASGKPLAVGLPAGTRVATVTVNGGGQVQTVAAVIDQPITGPSRRWRVERL